MLNSNPLTCSIQNYCLDKFRFGAALRAFRAIIVVSITIGSAVLFVQTAQAQEAPVDRTGLVMSLSETHGESTVAMGLTSNGGVLELLTSADGSTWTIIVTMPDGKSRLVGAGKAWMDVLLKPTGLPI